MSGRSISLHKNCSCRNLNVLNVLGEKGMRQSLCQSFRLPAPIPPLSPLSSLPLFSSLSRSLPMTAMTAVLLALSLNSCGGENSTTAQSPTSPTPVAISPNASSTQSPATGQSFAKPTVSPQNATPKGALPPDLISSTDPNQRVRAVQSNRPDPFALISTTPSVQLPPPPPVEPSSAPSAPTSASNSSQASSQASGQNRTTAATGQQSSQRSSSRSPSSNHRSVARKPVAPPPPQPELAKAVKVTGVVQVGSTLYAIVNAPNEPSSRYVQAGQSLSNGQVRVRRIETDGAEPKVVLEQFGIEIVRAVGEGGTPAGTPGTPGGAPATPTATPSPSPATAQPATAQPAAASRR